MKERQQKNEPGLDLTAPDCHGDTAIAWTFATFAAVIAAGVLWAALFYRAQHLAISPIDTGTFPQPVLMTASIACAALALMGAAIIRLTHSSRAHTTGAAFVILAAIGPVVAIATRYILAEALLLGALILTNQIRRRRPKPSEKRTTWQEPIGMLCGLLIGIQVAYLLWIFLALYAPVILALLGFALTVPTRTRSFANGLLAAAAGATTLITTYYVLLTILG